MNNYSTVVGLDVHKKTIVAAILPPGGNGTTQTVKVENHPKAVEKLVNRLSVKDGVAFVYEAGPCGYEVWRQIRQMGYPCAVIAPGLTPVRPGDRVKTDRRDAEKLARLYRAGELTVIRIPTHEEESVRDLVRAREDVVEDRLRVRHRLSMFLLRQGRVYLGRRYGGANHRAWLQAQRFAWPALQQTFEACVRAGEEAQARLESLDQQIEDLSEQEPYRTRVKYLRCLKGIETLTALTLLVEAQDFQRFNSAREFMSYTGLGVCERSSGQKIRRGSITKVGNAHIRRVLVESAWNARHRNIVSHDLAKRRKGCLPEVVQIAQRAQDRLHRKFWRMIHRDKPAPVAVIAVARELAGFVWAIAQHFPAVA